jgi:SAM-dependent methyltransferase
MDPAHFDELKSLEEHYWWHVAKRELVTEILTRRFPAPAALLEVGLGAGGNLLAFQKLGYEVAGFDIMPQAVEHCQRQGLEQVRVHNIVEPWPVTAGSVGVVVMLDVLEHIEDAVTALGHARTALSADGGIVLTVPAIPWLMGPWDRILGHHRRYSRVLLREHAQAAGLKVEWVCAWNSFTLPPALLVRVWERIVPSRQAAEFPRVSPTVNRLLLGWAAIERSLIRRSLVPVGLSLVGVLTK